VTCEVYRAKAFAQDEDERRRGSNHVLMFNVFIPHIHIRLGIFLEGGIINIFIAPSWERLRHLKSFGLYYFTVVQLETAFILGGRYGRGPGPPPLHDAPKMELLVH
jgi:hypothetical protein